MKWYIVESYFGRMKYLITKTKSILQPVRKVLNIRVSSRDLEVKANERIQPRFV